MDLLAYLEESISINKINPKNQCEESHKKLIHLSGKSCICICKCFIYFSSLVLPFLKDTDVLDFVVLMCDSTLKKINNIKILTKIRLDDLAIHLTIRGNEYTGYTHIAILLARNYIMRL